jgi:hypothetical protein
MAFSSRAFASDVEAEYGQVQQGGAIHSQCGVD